MLYVGDVPKTFSEEEDPVSSIHEVAKLSGVSVSTVSRVFNGYADVSASTRQRVLASARELDYAPSAAARTLVRRRSELIGVILYTGEEHPDIQHPFFQEVLVGLKRSIGTIGFDLLLFANEQPGSSRGGDPHSYLRRVRHHRVDGVVLMGVDRNDPEVEKLLQSQIPIIAVDLDVSGPRASYVSSDNMGGARLAVGHLHALGHSRVATISGPLNTKPGADRLLGYRAELQALGLESRPEYEPEGDFYAESGEAAMRVLLALPEPPTAIFAASDMMAIGALKTMRDAGVRCPKDVAIVGFDDTPLAGLLNPALTTIRQDGPGLGSAAGRSLVEMIEDSDLLAPVRVLPVELVVRESCGAGQAAGRRGATRRPGKKKEVA
jgi:LacI family transcriptional regulator